MCPVKCWRVLIASGQGLVGIPRAEPVFRSRLLLSQGDDREVSLQPVLGSCQTHREMVARASGLCCKANALPMSVHRSPQPVLLWVLSGRYLLLLFPCCGRKAPEAGVVSHVEMLLFSLGCSRAWLLRLPLWCRAGRSLPPRFHGAVNPEPLPA